MYPDLLPHILNGATALHLSVLVPGLVCALAADSIAATTLLGPLSEAAWQRLLRLHQAIVFTLVLLWISGLTLLALKLLPGGPGVSPKLMTKLTAVLILTANANLIGALALPRLQELRAGPFGTLPQSTRLTLGVIGGISSACWISALMLGALPQFKSMELVELAHWFVPLFACGTVGGIAMGLFAPVLLLWVPKGDLAGSVVPR